MKIAITMLTILPTCKTQESTDSVDIQEIAYEADPPEGFEGRVCWGGSYNSNATDNKPDVYLYCSHKNAVCQAKIEIRTGLYTIHKDCNTRSACLNNRLANLQQCFSQSAVEYNQKVCHFCCYTDNCNSNEALTTKYKVAYHP